MTGFRSKHLVFVAAAIVLAILTIFIDDRHDLDELMRLLRVWGLVALILIVALALTATLRRTRQK